jgi:teichuronic acid biosynthesis glycosyltransferase TuaG
MKNDPCVSIIMPAYNSSDYILESIKSVKDQSFGDFELVVVEDCSSDETLEVLRGLVKADTRIVLIENETNLGGAASRNKALSVARGRYIAFLDSDDIWYPSKLETQLKYMQKYEVSFCFTAYDEIGRGGGGGVRVAVPISFNRRWWLCNNFAGCLTVIYDTKFYGKVDMPDIKKRHDYALWLSLIKSGGTVMGLNKSLAGYRVGAGTLSKNKWSLLKAHNQVVRRYGCCGLVSSIVFSLSYLFLVVVKKRLKRVYSFFCTFINCQH